MTDTETMTFRLPDLGEGLTSAEVTEWLVEVGDVVAVDQPVVAVETAKARVEVPCPYAGVVAERHGPEGAELPVGAPLITIAQPEEGPDRAAPSGRGAQASRANGADGGTASPPSAPPQPTGPPAAPPPTGAGEGTASDGAPAGTGDGGSGQVLVGYGTGMAHGVSRARARRRAGARHSGAPSGGMGAPATPYRNGPPPVISPLVRRLAREHRIDLREVAGTGPDGLILRADVARAARASAVGSGPDAAQPGADRGAVPAPRRTSPDGEGTSARGADQPTEPAPHQVAGREARRTPLTGVVGAAAELFSRSRREIPDATCWVDADATELLAVRRAMGEPPVSLLALLARITTAALARYPELNATVDTAAREIVRLPAIHLGFAAQTDRGLLVPVVRDAHARTTQQLHDEISRLTERARSGALAPGELSGSTFTLNNYGVFGVDGSTPILNHPEAGMLGVGRIVPKPWGHGGEVVLRQVVQLSLTFDHRVCDGAQAGGFLRWIADAVEQPARVLREV